jgi:hypothetical protein
LGKGDEMKTSKNSRREQEMTIRRSLTPSNIFLTTLIFARRGRGQKLLLLATSKLAQIVKVSESG